MRYAPTSGLPHNGPRIAAAFTVDYCPASNLPKPAVIFKDASHSCRRGLVADGVKCALVDVWQRYRWLGPVGVQVVKQPLRQFEVGVDLIGSEKAQRLSGIMVSQG